MESFAYFFFITVAVISSVQFASAVKCYQCNSYYNTDCGFETTKLSLNHLKECEANATFCRKIEQTVPFEVNGKGPDHRLIRECGSDQKFEKSYYFASGYGGLQNVYKCDGDGCNSASITTFNLITALVTIIFLFISL